jgi:hypothetical protein
MRWTMLALALVGCGANGGFGSGDGSSDSGVSSADVSRQSSGDIRDSSAAGAASEGNDAVESGLLSEYVALGGTGGLGENIAAGAPSQTVASAVSSWINEVANYDHATNTCAAGKVCGHYTQIVWSTTTAVGCARVGCTTNSPFGAFADGLWDFEVCDFSPPGNIGSQAPY